MNNSVLNVETLSRVLNGLNDLYPCVSVSIDTFDESGCRKVFNYQWNEATRETPTSLHYLRTRGGSATYQTRDNNGSTTHQPVHVTVLADVQTMSMDQLVLTIVDKLTLFRMVDQSTQAIVTISETSENFVFDGAGFIDVEQELRKHGGKVTFCFVCQDNVVLGEKQTAFVKANNTL